MKVLSNQTIRCIDKSPILMDIYLPKSAEPVPVVLFAHGFKGFKDWGCWHLIAEAFAKKGFAFVKFNFSHNGTTLENPTEFADLEAFGHNTYSKEWADLNCVIDWITNIIDDEFNFDTSELTLIGHSRGGGMAIVKAANDKRIKNLVTWASVHSLAWLWSDEGLKEKWKKEGVIYQKNARTGQNMPLYYTLCSDYEAHQPFFDLEFAAPKIQQPWLIIHGEVDTSVPPSSANHLKGLQPNAQVCIISEADHVFGGKHPYVSNELPPQSIELVKATIDFLKP